VAGLSALDLGNGLTVTGEVKTGLRVESKDDSPEFDPDAFDSTPANWPQKDVGVAAADNSDDTRASLWNDDAADDLRTRLTFSYAGDQGGAELRLFKDKDSPTAVDLAYAYGWANFLDKKIVVYGGKIGGDLWGLGKLPINAFDPSLDKVTGVRAAFNVVPGLSFGFALPLDQVTYPFWDGSNWDSGTGNRTLGAVFGGAVIGGLYTSDFVSAAATLQLHPEINGKDYGSVEGKSGSGDNGYEKTPSWVDVILGVSVKPIEPLIVVADARIDTRTYSDDEFYFGDNEIGYARIGLKGEYAVIPALKASLKLDILIQNDSAERDTSDGSTDPFTQYYDTKKGTKLTKESYAEYKPVETYGDMSLGFEVKGDYTVNDMIGLYLAIGSDNVLWLAGDVSLNKDDLHKSTYRPGAGLYVKPGVTLALGSASIEIFDKIDKIGATDNQYFYQDSGDYKINSVSPITNQFQIEFVWSF
jgi:hypothetical protein